MTDQSVTTWLGQLRQGDQDAARKLWERYLDRLAGLAHARLQAMPYTPIDGEDVALSALRCLFLGVGQGRFADLADRIELWRVLATITARKARQALRDEQRRKRGGGLVVSETALGTSPDESSAGLAKNAARDLPPDLTAEMADECRRLLELLGDDELRTIAVWKMEGLTSEEIAGRLGKALSTVERRLRLIRDTWGADLSDPP
jgi:DNA-directed RNA polymerase specialized sigma24 family protein